MWSTTCWWNSGCGSCLGVEVEPLWKAEREILTKIQRILKRDTQLIYNDYKFNGSWTLPGDGRRKKRRRSRRCPPTQLDLQHLNTHTRLVTSASKEEEDEMLTKTTIFPSALLWANEEQQKVILPVHQQHQQESSQEAARAQGRKERIYLLHWISSSTHGLSSDKDNTTHRQVFEPRFCPGPRRCWSCCFAAFALIAVRCPPSEKESGRQPHTWSTEGEEKRRQQQKVMQFSKRTNKQLSPDRGGCSGSVSRLPPTLWITGGGSRGQQQQRERQSVKKKRRIMRKVQRMNIITFRNMQKKTIDLSYILYFFR